MAQDYVPPEMEMVYPETKKVNFESDILFKVVTFLDFTSRQGEKGEFIVVKAKSEAGEDISFATSSAILIKQIKSLKDSGKLADGVRARIDRPKGKRYYTLTAPKA